MFLIDLIDIRKNVYSLNVRETVWAPSDVGFKPNYWGNLYDER